jgi:hypothetical protein
MSNETYIEVAKKISDSANKQVLSHIIMVLKQLIETRLKKGGDANSEFENRVSVLFGGNVVKNGRIPDYKAYIDVKGIDVENSDGMNTFARVFPRIDKVYSTNNDQDISYALQLKITSRGEIFSRYENGFISERCARFAVGHDIGDIVLNLNHLIECANAGGTIPNDEIPRHYQSDFFSYMLSDLRDYDLLGLSGSLNLNKSFEDYKSKIEAKVNIALQKEAIRDENFEMEKTKRFEDINEVLKKSMDLHRRSGHCKISMAYSVFALKEVISQKINSSIDSKLNDLRDVLSEKIKLKEECEDVLNELNKLDKERSRISIHLIDKKGFGGPTISCYTRGDSNTGQNLHCFEIIICQSSEENGPTVKKREEKICKEICQAIGCIYFGYHSIIKKINDGHYNDTVSGTIQKCKLDRNTIEKFANELYKLRLKTFEDKIQLLEGEENLMGRLKKLQ